MMKVLNLFLAVAMLSVSVQGLPGTLVFRHSGKCLDLANGNKSNGAPFQQYSCAGNQNQQFVLLTAGRSNGNEVVLVQNLASGKCLDVSFGNRSNGAKIQQWNCRGNNPNLRFEMRHINGSSTWFELRNRATNKCVDVSGISRNNFAKIHQWKCTGRSNQIMKFV